MNQAETALVILRELIQKSGVREWSESEIRQQLIIAANEMAAGIYEANSMALPDSLLYVPGTQIVFADHADDFGPANDPQRGTPTEVQLSLASVANGAARQSAKVDLAIDEDGNFPPAFRVWAGFELAATPSAGNQITLHWAESPSATAGTANPGGISGADAAYAGYSSNLASSLTQLNLIGPFNCTVQATGTVQMALVGTLVPKMRYGSLVVYNQSGAAFHSDDVECWVLFEPILPRMVD